MTPEEEKAARKREKRKRKKEKRKAEQGVWSAALRAQTKTGSQTSVKNGEAPHTKKKRKSTGVRSLAPVATPPPKVVTVALSVNRLINRLPDRSMAELQQQWLNVVAKLGGKGPQKGLINFRDALMAEWERRFQLAQDDPDYFDWPSTHPGIADGSLKQGLWLEEGMLSYLGYHVGTTRGVADGVRRQILDAVFQGALPPVNGPDYVKSWGAKSSPLRLKRLAQEIARLAVNAKRKKSANLDSAIADWERDLKYLHREYYVGKFGFGWPVIS